MSKYKTIYIDTGNLDYAYDKCDLGEFKECLIGFYPRKDDLPNLTALVEHAALDEAVGLLLGLQPWLPTAQKQMIDEFLKSLEE